MKIINHSRQNGFTIVELMISLLLSTILIYAIGGILIASNRAASTSDTLGDTQDTGRFVADYMHRQLLRAGFNPSPDVTSGFDPFPGLCAAVDDFLCSREVSNGTGDRIAIRRVAEAAEEAGDPVPVSCAGAELTDTDGNAIVEDVVVVDAYWVEEVNGLSNLRCQTYDENGTIRAAGAGFGNAQSLASGMLSIHALYGESDTPPDSKEVLAVKQYVNADQVDRWNRIYSVRLAITTRAAEESAGSPWRKQIQVMDSQPLDVTDRVARQVFTTTTALMNLREDSAI